MAKSTSSDMRPAILSISSQVAYGPVGNSAAVPAMERLGFTVLAVPTIVLAHHPGHGGTMAGVRVPARDLAAMLDALAALGVLADVRGVLTGYFAANDQIFGVARIIRRLKEENAGLLYLCDPVLGDEQQGLYVAEPVAEAVRAELVPLADVITPNTFELQWLASTPVADAAGARQAARHMSTACVVATSVPDGRDGLLTMAFSGGREESVSTRRRGDVPHGTGDLFAGLFLARRLMGDDEASALAGAIAAIERVIDASEGSPALDLVRILS